MKNVAEKKYVGTSYHGVPIPWRTADTNGNAIFFPPRVITRVINGVVYTLYR